jgi:hypothetical protein
MEIERESGVKQASCWCTAVKFDADLLARVPADKRNLACICEKCAQSANLLSKRPEKNPEKAQIQPPC